MIGLFASLLPSLFKLGGKMIKDADKQQEYAFKVLEMSNDLALKMLDTKTYPWIDGLVKLSYASEQIIKGLFRPLGAACMTGFLIYAEINEIQLSGTVETLCAAAFPGWMASRHADKKDKAKKKTDFFDEDG